MISEYLRLKNENSHLKELSSTYFGISNGRNTTSDFKDLTQKDRGLKNDASTNSSDN